MTDELYGTRPPEILFIERCWQLLKPGGRMAIVLPDGILGNPDLEYVRYWMMTHCRIIASIDLHPDVVSNAQMGLVFEELIRKFAELSNETAGEHFTPREVIRLMVNLLFIEDDQALTRPGVVRSLSWNITAAPTGGAASAVWTPSARSYRKASNCGRVGSPMVARPQDPGAPLRGSGSSGGGSKPPGCQG